MSADPIHGDPPSADPDEFRRALGCFVTGVTVVAVCEGDGTPRGITANAFTSVSLEPPLVLVCIAHDAESHDVFRRCGRFAVSILSQSQQGTSTLFATKSPTKFEQVAWRRGHGGVPVLEDAVAWVECVPHERVDAGDHLILIGRVVDIGHSTRQPLGYCRGNYITFELEQQAVMRRPGQRVRVGCVLDGGGSVLLLRAADAGGWTLPLARSAPDERDDAADLRGTLDALGVRASLGFLFAVFEAPGSDELLVFYRGEIDDLGGMAAGAGALFAYDAIPWGALPSEAMRAMLRRYVAERAELELGAPAGDDRVGSPSLLSPSE